MRRLISAAVLAGAVAVGGMAVPAGAVDGGVGACTPGYWKNHTDNWKRATTDTVVGSIFAGATTATSGASFLEALSFKGGKGLEGAERILMRAAVAGYLNEVHTDLGYPLSRNGIVRRVDEAIATQQRDEMIAMAAFFDDLNNAPEGCPLS